MPSILFILLVALVMFEPRKLLHVATNVVPSQHPWQKLMRLMTSSVDADTQKTEWWRSALSEPLPSLTPNTGSE